MDKNIDTMNEESTPKTTQEVGREVAAYFRENNISYLEVAERLGYESRQVVANQLAGKTFGKQVAEKYAKAFGFNELFLLTGKGSLMEESKDGEKGLIKELMGMIKSLQETVKSQQETVKSQQELIYELRLGKTA